MKKIICVLLSVCMLCLAGCHDDGEKPQVSQSTTPTKESEPPVIDEGEKVSLLTLEKSLHTNFEWAEDFNMALVWSAYSDVTLGQEDAENFPEMAEVLSQIATMQSNTMEDEFDNLVEFAHQELAQNRNGFETHVSTSNVQVRRGDSMVVSLLWDSYAHYGQIDNLRVFHGSNYDTRTGKALALNDVVKEINNDLAKAVEKELTGHMWTGKFHSEHAVENYFANMPYDGFNWTLDYTGVTFYFAPGDLCDEGFMTATVSFAEYPEFFREEYMATPAEYTVELPLHLSFFTELDTDGILEALSVSGQRDMERINYVNYGVYTEAGQYDGDCFVYDLHPYYVKTENGHYLYLFREDFQEGWRSMELIVFALKADGSVAEIGKKNVSPAWLADNRFLMPTDPNRLILDDADAGTEKIAFTVGNDGIPSII